MRQTTKLAPPDFGSSEGRYAVMIGKPDPDADSPRSVDHLFEALDSVKLLKRCDTEEAAKSTARTFNSVMLELDRWSDVALPAWTFVVVPLESEREVE